ncbi:MAG: helix-turn-helix domain-containing protein [Vicinamibacterales bacterium]
MLGEAGYEAAWKQAQTVPIADAVAEALAVGASWTPPTLDVSPSESPSHPLSPRALDVVRGIVEGKSNQVIAAIPFISPNTVTNHVTNILNKLGLDSRTAVATWAVRQGID